MKVHHEPPPMSHYAIGDIQGCFETLTALLEHIHFNPDKDRLWFAGDLVNRGPKSLETLRLVKSLGNQAVTVLGNHDLHLIALTYGKTYKPQRDNTLLPVMNAPDRDELIDWLRKQPLIHTNKTLGFTMVHAGIAPQWTLAQAHQYAHEIETALTAADPTTFLRGMYGDEPAIWDKNLQGIPRLRLITNYLTRMRFITRDYALDLRYKGPWDTSSTKLIPWFRQEDRKTKHDPIIFGHWAALNGQTNTANTYALDTGCIWGGSLTAMRLEDKTIFSVPNQDF